MMRRGVLVAGGLGCLVAGVVAGLARIGAIEGAHVQSHAAAHGALMVGGFLGTLIGLERAVALERSWALAGPGLSLLAAGLLLGNSASLPAPWLMLGASLVLLQVSVVLGRRAPGTAANVMSLGALAWALGNLRWAVHGGMQEAAWLWACFPIFVIAGERFELAAMIRLTHWGRRLFPPLLFALGVGAWIAPAARPEGAWLMAVGMAGISLWLLRFDTLLMNLRKPGLPRFLGIALSLGYAWLLVAGLLLPVWAAERNPFAYDAVLHAVFLGFVFSMIFAHAPVIFPALLGRPMRFSRLFYAHLVLMSASLALRVAGDLMTVQPLRVAAAWLNAAALAIFLLNNAQGLLRAKSGPPFTSL